VDGNEKLELSKLLLIQREIVMAKSSYPRNRCVRNGPAVEWYLFFLRRKWRIPARVIGLLLGCEIRCEVPDRIFIPHTNGIVADTCCKISNDVVLLQQVTLGGIHPYYDCNIKGDEVDPILKEGVFVGAGAKILGHITIGEWSVIGANAVITIDLPPYSIAVGHNKVLDKKTTELKWDQ
jgi:serine acetyltransferase